MMDLPDFLATADGEIRLKGHRISLVLVAKLYNEGRSVEMIAAELPTLPLSLIHKVVAFYLDNHAAVDALVAAHDRETERLVTESHGGRATPTIAELRKRLDTMRRAGRA